MAFNLVSKLMVAITILYALFILPIDGARRPQRRTDLVNVPPIAASGYVVPLQGGETCHAVGNCTDTLTAPPASKTLRYLALGRGILTYSCDGRQPSEKPLYVSQDTSLWDAAPLIPRISNEELFHTIIPQLYEFDYTKLANSTLVCIGFIKTVRGTAVVDLFNVEAFGINIQEMVDAPELPSMNLGWTHESSSDLAWDVYRVKTVAGRAPETCAGQTEDIDVDYAAEYWFYHD